MKLTRSILASLTFAGSVWIASWYWHEAMTFDSDQETKRVELIALAKMFDADKAKQESIKAYTDLEAKRTTVQLEIKRIVIAELQRCRKNKKACI